MSMIDKPRSNSASAICRWSENEPGWSVVVSLWQIGGGEQTIKLAETSDVSGGPNPLRSIMTALDAACREGNVHPACLSGVTLKFDAGELHDLRDRMRP